MFNFEQKSLYFHGYDSHVLIAQAAVHAGQDTPHQVREAPPSGNNPVDRKILMVVTILGAQSIVHAVPDITDARKRARLVPKRRNRHY